MPCSSQHLDDFPRPFPWGPSSALDEAIEVLSNHQSSAWAFLMITNAASLIRASSLMNHEGRNEIETDMDFDVSETPRGAPI